ENQAPEHGSERASESGAGGAEKGDGQGFLVVEDLHAGYGAVRVLHGVSLRVDEGDICAILGPNGAGKTTLLRALCGMVRGQGTVRAGGVALTGPPPGAVARGGGAGGAARRCGGPGAGGPAGGGLAGSGGFC